MDVEPGYNEGSNNVADAEAKRFRANRAANNPSTASEPSGTGVEFQPFGADGLTFGDVLDLINPLQHIRVVSSIYRAITGDELSPAARIAGGTLFGGPFGLVSAVANTAVQAFSGRDIGETVFAALLGENSSATDAGIAADPAANIESQLAATESLDVGLPISLLPGRLGTSTDVVRVAEAAPYLAPQLARSTLASARASGPLPRTIAVAKNSLTTQLASLQSNTPSSLLAMANAGVSGRSEGPISALLQARAAVPSPGRVTELGTIFSRRVEPPANGAVAVLPSNLYQAQNNHPNAQQVSAPPARTASLPAVAAPSPTPSSEESITSPLDSTASPTSTPLVPLGQPLSSFLVPRAMMAALDKYEALKRAPQSATSSF